MAYEAAQQRVDEQARVLDNYRSRAATVVSAAAIATSFLGELAVGHGRHVDGWDWAAIVCLAGSVATALAVLFPIPGWIFSRSATKLIETYIECPDPQPLWRVQRNEALHLDLYANANRSRLRRVEIALVVSGVLLVTEIGIWIVAILR